MIFSLIKQMLIVLLSFSSCLAARYFLNDEPSIVRPNLNNLNPVELKY